MMILLFFKDLDIELYKYCNTIIIAQLADGYKRTCLQFVKNERMLGLVK